MNPSMLITSFKAALLIGLFLLASNVSMAASTSPEPLQQTSEGARQVFEEARGRIYQIRTLTADGDA